MRLVLCGSWAIVQDSASTSKVKDAAARRPSGQVMGCAVSAKAGNSMVFVSRLEAGRGGGGGGVGHARQGRDRGRLACAGQVQELAVEPRTEKGVGPCAGESPGEPGQIPSAQGDGGGALH